MHPKAAALLDAHTRHVMQQLTGDKLVELVNTEAATYCAWLSTRSVDSLLDEVRVRDFIVRNILSVELSDSLRDQIRTMVKRGIKSPLNKNTKIEDVLNVKEYDLIVEKLIALEDARRDIIHGVLNNQAYSDFLSDLLFQNMKDYLLEENPLAKKVPGVSSLLKMGKGVMDKVGSGLEGAMEHTVKNYIKRNIRSTIEMSERMIENAMAAPKLRSVARQLWSRIKGRSLAEFTRYVHDQNVDDSADIINTLWNHLRQTTYARELTNELVHAWFAQWGKRSGMQVLEDIGLSQARVAEELRQILIPYVDAMRESGFLEPRVRAYLEPFYSSDAVVAILES